MGYVFSLWKNTTMYRSMLYFLLSLVFLSIFLSAIGALSYDPWAVAGHALLFVAACWAINSAIARIANVKPNAESPLISGLILALIVGPLSLAHWGMLLGIAAAAMVSKYIFILRRSHIFNPAAFGALAGALLFGYPASWWVGSASMAPLVIAGGLLMVYKIRRFALVGAFLLSYLLLLVLDFMLVQHSDAATIALVLKNALFSSPILFFVFVMLVEPLTSPQTKSKRMIFGVAIGAGAFSMQTFLPQVPYSLELSLIGGNILARLMNADFRQSFVLKKKSMIDSIIGQFWFDPARAFGFIPGQFLEYTLAHPHADSRGMRRYFTIASSPTEKGILLATRYSPKGSTFKKNLFAMEAGDEVVASKVAGDFTLPHDTSKKLAFIAGGIGITPYRSIVKYLLDTMQSRDIILLYSAKNEHDFVFQDIFSKAHQTFGMKTVYTTERIDEKIIQNEVPDRNERIFYTSGPEPMVEAMEKILTAMGIPKERIKQDFFPGYHSND